MKYMIVESFVGVIVIAWLIALTLVITKMRARYKRLASRTKTGSIDDVLDELITKDRSFEKSLGELLQKTKVLEEAIQNHYQKLGFVRFNPFDRVGGDQSFVIALLDTKNTGVVLNFLYTRDGIRVYAKRVTAGKSAEYELSAEETEAIQNAH
jgi:hypothetical protein